MDTEKIKKILRSHLTEVDARFGTHTVIPEDSIDEICEELVAALAELSAQPDHATRYGHCTGCKTGGTHYLGSIEHPDPEDGSDEDPAPVLVAFSDIQIDYLFLGWLGANYDDVNDEKADLHSLLGRAFKEALAYANTRAVSVDHLVEVVKPFLYGDKSPHDGYNNPMGKLREAFAKLVTNDPA